MALRVGQMGREHVTPLMPAAPLHDARLAHELRQSRRSDRSTGHPNGASEPASTALTDSEGTSR